MFRHLADYNKMAGVQRAMWQMMSSCIVQLAYGNMRRGLTLSMLYSLPNTNQSTKSLDSLYVNVMSNILFRKDARTSLLFIIPLYGVVDIFSLFISEEESEAEIPTATPVQMME